MSLIEQIRDGRTDLVFALTTPSKRANTSDSNGVSLIQWCAYYGDVSAIRFLIANGESLSSLGENLDLNGAAFHGHWQLCQFLIENGADVNYALPTSGETPLHSVLARANRPATNHIIKILLSYGANVNCKSKEASSTGNFMRDCKTRGESPLHLAAAFGSLDTIDMLLDAGAIVNSKDMYGDSPLTWASRHRRPAYILERLCYGEFSINSEAVRTAMVEHGIAWSIMDRNLLGKPHI
jgi:uncharacterized protein